METSQASQGKCSCPCHKMVGLFIALIGLIFLLGAFGVISQRVVGVTWPILVILIGVQKICGSKCKCCANA
jgi:hypothetical protein